MTKNFKYLLLVLILSSCSLFKPAKKIKAYYIETMDNNGKISETYLHPDGDRVAVKNRELDTLSVHSENKVYTIDKKRRQVSQISLSFYKETLTGLVKANQREFYRRTLSKGQEGVPMDCEINWKNTYEMKGQKAVSQPCEIKYEKFGLSKDIFEKSTAILDRFNLTPQEFSRWKEGYISVKTFIKVNSPQLGEQDFSSTLLKWDEREVRETVFEIPKDYKVSDLPLGYSSSDIFRKRMQRVRGKIEKMSPAEKKELTKSLKVKMKTMPKEQQNIMKEVLKGVLEL